MSRTQGLRHVHRFAPGLSGTFSSDRKAAPLIELHGIDRNVRHQPHAAGVLREPLREHEHYTAMPEPLDIRTNCYSAKYRRCCIDVDPNDTDGIATVKQQLGMVARRLLIWPIFVVDAKLSACFE
jgi:hypothetical protein